MDCYECFDETLDSALPYSQLLLVEVIVDEFPFVGDLFLW